MTARTRGVPGKELDDDELREELHSLYRTREETFLNGSDDALMEHTKRMLELENEFMRRFPRETRPARRRTRAGARGRLSVRSTKRKPQASTLRRSR